MPVLRQYLRGAEPYYILRSPGMSSARVPLWMTEPAAARYRIRNPPLLSRDALMDLRHQVDVVLSTKRRSELATLRVRTGPAKKITAHRS